MTLRAALLLLTLAAAAAASSPAEAYELARRDLERLPPDARPHARYLSLYHERDPRKLASWKKVLDFWANSLSREAELCPLAEVAPALWRLDLRDYRLSREVWEKLQDPYFQAKVKVTRKKARDWPGGVWTDGRYYAPGAFQVEAGEETVTKRAQAPWLDPKAAQALVLLAQSEAPVARADWWLVETSQQAGRNGTGYFDFLKIKDRGDVDRLAGLDRKKAVELQKEVRAILKRRGPALNNAQIERLQSLNGGFWTTLDSKKSTGKNNAIRNLNGDYEHDAEEIYFVLPNSLFGFFAGDAKGVRQDSVPDFIAGDNRTAAGNDLRIHPHSCVKCHTDGLRPIDDWARKVYRSPLSLASPDYEKLKRLRRLYLSDLERHLRRDREDYAEALFKLTGWKPEELARNFARLHASYQEADVDLATLAAWGGATRPQALAALKRAAKAGPLDPALAGYLQAPEETARVEHVEEAFPLFMQVLLGYSR